MQLLDMDALPFLDASSSMSSAMKMDIKETDSAYEMHVDLPGVEKKDVKLSVDHGMLTISAERETHKEEEDKQMKRMERFSGRVSRTLNLPETVEMDKIDAKFENGVLLVTVPKSPEHEKRMQPKQIEIK